MKWEKIHRDAEGLIVMEIDAQNEGFMERKVRNREIIVEVRERLENKGNEERLRKRGKKKIKRKSGGYVQSGMKRTAGSYSFLRFKPYEKEHE